MSEQQESKRVFRTLYDFSASEKVELSVRKDDIVLASVSASLSEDWVHVEKFSDPSAKGYIPASTFPPC
jgi:hypothetical protein